MSVKGSLERRLACLENKLHTRKPGSGCPRCMAMASNYISEEGLDARIQAYLSGNPYETYEEPLPAPSPTCPYCQKTAAMSEEELDAQLHRWIKQREKYKGGYRT